MGQKIDRTYLFERMPVGQAVRRQIIPSIASQMVILLYNLADTYFVGLLNDAAQTAAVSLAYSVTLLMTALANLFAVGGAGRIAQLLGRHDRDGAREVCAVSFWFALLASAAFCVLFTLLSSPILRLCGATDETYALACGYSRWVISVGGTFSILNTVLANLIRADGSAFAASMGVSAGGIINMLLDPLFVLPRFLGMGAEGAGLATAISNAAGMLILLGIIPCLLILPILTPLVVVLALLTYFKESRRADELCKARMELVEGELPRFVATIHQELAASRDVLRILENYKKHAGPDFARELDVLTADMRSSSYEAALIRFEARMGSAIISDIVRGLVGILRGDDGRMYFQMLSHDLKALELQRLKAKAAKIPPKIRVFSFLMLMCFMLTYIVIIVYQIINSLGALF